MWPRLIRAKNLGKKYRMSELEFGITFALLLTAKECWDAVVKVGFGED